MSHQNFSSATSLAMLAPISTLMGMPRSAPNHFRDELQPLGALVYPLGYRMELRTGAFIPTEGLPHPEICPFQFTVRQCPSPKVSLISAAGACCERTDSVFM